MELVSLIDIGLYAIGFNWRQILPDPQSLNWVFIVVHFAGLRDVELNDVSAVEQMYDILHSSARGT